MTTRTSRGRMQISCSKVWFPCATRAILRARSPPPTTWRNCRRPAWPDYLSRYLFVTTSFGWSKVVNTVIPGSSNTSAVGWTWRLLDILEEFSDTDQRFCRFVDDTRHWRFTTLHNLQFIWKMFQDQESTTWRKDFEITPKIKSRRDAAMMGSYMARMRQQQRGWRFIKAK